MRILYSSFAGAHYLDAAVGASAPLGGSRLDRAAGYFLNAAPSTERTGGNAYRGRPDCLLMPTKRSLRWVSFEGAFSGRSWLLRRTVRFGQIVRRGAGEAQQQDLDRWRQPGSTFPCRKRGPRGVQLRPVAHKPPSATTCFPSLILMLKLNRNPLFPRVFEPDLANQEAYFFARPAASVGGATLTWWAPELMPDRA